MNTPKIGKTTYVVVYRVKREEFRFYRFCQECGLLMPSWKRVSRMRKSDNDVTPAGANRNRHATLGEACSSKTFYKVAHFDS